MPLVRRGNVVVVVAAAFLADLLVVAALEVELGHAVRVVIIVIVVAVVIVVVLAGVDRLVHEVVVDGAGVLVLHVGLPVLTLASLDLDLIFVLIVLILSGFVEILLFVGLGLAYLVVDAATGIAFVVEILNFHFFGGSLLVFVALHVLVELFVIVDIGDGGCVVLFSIFVASFLLLFVILFILYLF